MRRPPSWPSTARPPWRGATPASGLKPLADWLRLNDAGQKALLADWLQGCLTAASLDEAMAQRDQLQAGE